MKFKLTPAQRQQIKAGEYPHLALSVEEAEELEPDTITLRRDQLWVEIRGAAKDKRKRWHVDYRVHDHRPRFLRRSPHGVDFAAIRSSYDSIGVPRAVTEQTAAEAEEASHYTTSPAQADTDAGEAVPREYQDELTKRANRRFAELERDEREEQVRQRDLQRVNAEVRELVKRAVKMGVDPAIVLAPIERELRAQHDDLSKAA